MVSSHVFMLLQFCLYLTIIIHCHQTESDSESDEDSRSSLQNTTNNNRNDSASDAVTNQDFLVRILYHVFGIFWFQTEIKIFHFCFCVEIFSL
jgi:hypothetical protein